MTKKNIPCTNCKFHNQEETCIGNIRLFSALSNKVREDLVKSSLHNKYDAGMTLINEGQEATKILVIRSGRVKICRYDAAGTEYILDVLHDGQAVWHDLFLQDHKYHYSVITMTEVELCSIRRDDFITAISRNPEAAFNLISLLSTELTEAKNKAMMLSIRDPGIRLVGFLLERDEHCLNHVIHLKLDEIASSVCLRPETVSRNLTRLERGGYIKRIGRGALKVMNRAALSDLYKEKGIST